jgi:DNA-directed RNA polymerase specialized sigma24 family protein
MKSDEYTAIGGNRGRFQTTHWTAIEAAGSDDTGSRLLLDDLLQRYWKPVYCYLRRKGYDNEQAKDLTQGFFHEVVLGRELIRRADHTKGRFRTLLLTALDRYLVSLHRKQTAQKRIPHDRLIHLGHGDSGELPVAVDKLSSEESFNYAWVSQLLDRMLTEVEAECCACGMTIHWKLFCARVLQPIMEATEAPSLVQISQKYGIQDTPKASNMIFAVKRRFQTALRRHLRESVASEAEVNEEMQELMKFLSKKRQ